MVNLAEAWPRLWRLEVEGDEHGSSRGLARGNMGGRGGGVLLIGEPEWLL